jgi:hypothetical protein
VEAAPWEDEKLLVVVCRKGRHGGLAIAEVFERF